MIRNGLPIGYRHNAGVNYSYARVSTDYQSFDVQVRQLRAVGCKKVFLNVVSGAKTDRTTLAQIVAQIGGTPW